MSTITHEVLNQPPPLSDYNLFETDKALVESVSREGAAWAMPELKEFGQKLGKQEVIALGFQSNQYPPVLKTHDRFGHRIDQVEFHPAWHQLMNLSISHGLHSGPWREEKAGAHVARAAKMFLMSQIEFGHLCPISMTYSVVPALKKQKDVFKDWEKSILSTTYDSRFLPMKDKKGVTLGMGMTEKQGGSDVRANTTKAAPINKGGPGGDYKITGHKWFCSAPMSDAFLILAQAPGGLSCFLLPRWKPDGTQNIFLIQRLKDKLGNRSNASSEVEFNDSWAQMVGEEGRGVPTIIEMVNHTRLDCVIGSSALMRQAVAQATHHATYRTAFGKKLIDQPLMQNVLADLCLESEAATLLTMRLAHAYDHRSDEFEDAFRRIATAVAKYWVCKRAPSQVYEALECHGGSGFVEESIMPRLYREAPLNSIWEGSGNVICLDVLRAATKEPKTLEALLTEIKKVSDPKITDFLESIPGVTNRAPTGESEARLFVERLALALQASLIRRYSPSEVADAFISSRIEGHWGHTFGTLSKIHDFKSILSRARPLL